MWGTAEIISVVLGCFAFILGILSLVFGVWIPLRIRRKEEFRLFWHHIGLLVDQKNPILKNETIINKSFVTHEFLKTLWKIVERHQIKNNSITPTTAITKELASIKNEYFNTNDKKIESQIFYKYVNKLKTLTIHKTTGKKLDKIRQNTIKILKTSSQK